MTPMALSGGTLTFLVFVAIFVFAVVGYLSLRKHLRRAADLPWEQDLTEAGRRAQEFEHPGV